MIRQHVVPKSLQGESHFRWRGGDVSRVEALSDAVFALALTLLIVSLDVPNTFAELLATFEQIPSFAACAAVLVMCWYFHYEYHRRYGLEDFLTVVLNAVLLFLILIYVYPLKFLFGLLFEMFFGLGDARATAREAGLSVITSSQWPTLMIIYSAGFVSIFVVFALMNLRAYRLRRDLELDPVETYLTIAAIRAHLISAGVGLGSIGVVLLNPALFPWAGGFYFLMTPFHFAHGFWSGKVVERMSGELGGAEAALP